MNAAGTPFEFAGLGIWFWKLSQCGNFGEIWNRLANVSCRYAIVKIAHGFGEYNKGYLNQMVNLCHDANIAFTGFVWPNGFTPEDEASFHAYRAKITNVKALVINAEFGDEDKRTAWFEDDAAEKAEQYMMKLRSLLSVPLILSSYGWPSNQPRFPFAEFLKYCDFVMPQCYWFNADPLQKLTDSLDQYRRFRKPIILTGAAYEKPNNGIGNIHKFEKWVKAARNLGGFNLWSYQHMSPQMWAVLEGLKW